MTESATRLAPLESVKALLAGAIDYAGLFPPSQLSMEEAVLNFAKYRQTAESWMLGRFVCPVSALDEFSLAADPFLPRDAGAVSWRLAVTGSGSAERAIGVRLVLDTQTGEVLSRLRMTTPGRIDFNWNFVRQVATYGLLPLIAIIASLFPEVGGSLFGWLEPLRKLVAP